VGVPVVAFEPNPTCYSYFERVCRLNNLSPPEWKQIALGDRAGDVDLLYPERETWMGSISKKWADRNFSEGRGIKSASVPLYPLDAFLDQAIGKRLLVKVDVEGGELDVFRGALAY
jgi:FkbM family methyltransferase